MTAQRDPWLDNAKMALVTLVVVGHSWTLLPHNGLDDHLYDFLYAWHVPAFVFVTGYLSRSFDWTSRRMWQLVQTVAVPYVLFEAVLAVFRLYVGGERLQDLWADPHWPMWYLSALFFWRLLTPVFRRMPAVAAVVVALAVSLLLGAVAPTTLDLARVVGLLPFFVLGLVATPERLGVLRTRAARLAAVPVLVGIWVLTAWTDGLAQTEWLYYRTRYDALGADLLTGVLTRGGVLVVGALGAAAFLALVPPVRGWFTALGRMTLVVYLFHGFVVLSARYAGYGGFADAHPVPALLLTTVAAVAVALLLASHPVAGVLQHAVDPLGYAQRHVTHAVALTEVATEVEAEAEGETGAAPAVPAQDRPSMDPSTDRRSVGAPH